MEKSIALSAIIIMIVWFVIFLFKKYYFRHLKFHNIVDGISLSERPLNRI